MLQNGSIALLNTDAPNFVDPDDPFIKGELVYVDEIDGETCRITGIHSARSADISTDALTPTNEVWTKQYLMSEQRMRLYQNLNRK